MMLSAYAQATAARELQIWVGLFGAPQPPAAPQFFVNGHAVAPVRGGAPTPIRDGSGENFRGVYALAPPGRGPYRVRVQAGDAQVEIATDLLRPDLPAALDGSFNILLCSCYYQPRDDRGLLGDVVGQIKLRPDLTLMAGDQVYADLPLRGLALPRRPAEIRADIGRKYRQNWASSALGTPGLASVLARAPVVCVPDDHEYWNNYPYRQAQIPDTLWQDSRDGWARASEELYQDYQVSEATAQGAARLDVGPLKMLFMDLRSRRDANGERLMEDAARQAFVQWADDLLATPQGIGLLSSGQALFLSRPGALASRLADAEMPNYRDFDALVMAQLARLADGGVPLLYITGDVHWGRVAQAQDLRHRGSLLYEVIASPCCLIDSPMDGLAQFKRRLFGTSAPWPRHAEAADLPGQFGPHGRFLLQGLQRSIVGDQVAMLQIARAGAGAQFSVSYYGISRDKALAKSRTYGPYPLRSI